MSKKHIYIRFNNRNDNDNPLPWRVLTQQGEHDGVLELTQEFASEVRFSAPVVTSEDQIAAGVFKWHIKSSGYVSWQGDICLVSEEQPA
ncbi:hypothetical protein SAMN05216517_106192 [Janthinobacterium sp. OK676]|uniref:hypothetical protein n=1 Tax=unclassified Janthinobacterium TaxID=2610881 RepID=UPI00087F2A3D|nr:MULTISPECIES: hypothetical protein [unclassified Janthinobacterium]PJJ19548.1 hypothetical protein CLU90_2771 [Janthinobacterium sp. 67]SDM81171.1 hypothetical protein SAMN05216517_106192 [Janthinobacterium sp. OK676]